MDQYSFPQPDPVPGFDSTFGGQPQAAPAPSFSPQDFPQQPMPQFMPNYSSPMQGTMPLAMNFAMQDAQRTLQATLQGSIMAAQSFSQRVGSIMAAGNHAIFGRPQQIQYAGPGQYAFNSTLRAELFYAQGSGGFQMALAGGPKPQFMSEGMYQRALGESLSQRFSEHRMWDYAGSMAGLALPMMGMGLVPGLAVGLGAPLLGKVSRGISHNLYEQKEQEEGWKRDMFTRYQRGTQSFLSKEDSYAMSRSLGEHDAHSLGARMLSEFGFDEAATKYFRKDQLHMDKVREQMQSLDMFRGSTSRGKEMGELVKSVAKEMKEFAEIAGMLREESIQVMAALQKGSGYAAGSSKLKQLWGSAAWTAAATGANPNEIANIGNQAMMVARMNGGDTGVYANHAYRQFRNVNALQSVGAIDPTMDAAGYTMASHSAMASGLRSNPFYWGAVSPNKTGNLVDRSIGFFKSLGGGNLASGVALAMNGGAEVNGDPAQVRVDALRDLTKMYQDGGLNFAAARRMAAINIMEGNVENARALEAEAYLNKDGMSNAGRINDLSTLVRDKDRLREHLISRGMTAKGADSVIAGLEDQLSTKGPVDVSSLGLASERFKNLMHGSQARDFVDSKLGRTDGWGASALGQALINGDIRSKMTSSELIKLRDYTKANETAINYANAGMGGGSQWASQSNDTHQNRYTEFKNDITKQLRGRGWSSADAEKAFEQMEKNDFRDFDTAFTKGKSIDPTKLATLTKFIASEFDASRGGSFTEFASKARAKAEELFGSQGSEMVEAALNAAKLKSGRAKQIQVARDSLGLQGDTERAANAYFLLKGASNDLGGYRKSLEKHFGASMSTLYQRAGLAGKSYSEQAVAAEAFLRKEGLASYEGFGSYVAAMLNNDGAVSDARFELSRRSDLEGIEELSDQKIKAAGRALKNRSDALSKIDAKERSAYEKKYGVDLSQGFNREAADLIEKLRSASSSDERQAALSAVKGNSAAKSFLYGNILTEVNAADRDNLLDSLQKGTLTGEQVRQLDPVFRPQGVSIEGLSSAYDLKSAQEAAMKRQEDMKAESSKAISKLANVIEIVYNKLSGKS